MWEPGQGLPHDGWFDGNVDLMIEWGTYADYRPRIVERVQDGFYGMFKDPHEKKIEDSKKLLAEWDKKWEAIPVEDRLKKREVVANAVTPRMETVQTVKGPVRAEVCTPSGEYREAKKRNAKKRRRPARSHSGAITSENNPLLSTKSEQWHSET